jgi:aromatic-L-amino-acid/L-tryptophan decarboxylase
MDPESFRKHGHDFVDWLADYFARIEDMHVKPDTKPGDIIRQLPPAPPQTAEPMEHIFRDFQQLILPGMTHWQHPGWMAYFPANNSPASVLAEMLTAGLGAQCMSWQTSPAATELEERVMDWLRQMIGLPEPFSGVIQDTASTATLCALLSARERASEFKVNQEGMNPGMRVYITSETHSSIEKGVKIAGYGKGNLRIVDTDMAMAMNPLALEWAIKEDLEAGDTPACVVATLGSTSSMAMDPVQDIAAVCSKYNVWLHVDAAFAGTAAMVPELNHFMRGVEQADSFVFNPHKWMMTNFDCSAYFVKDAATLVRTFEIHPEYLKTAADQQVKNYRDWGIQLGRRFRALKLWFVIRSYGVEGIQHMVREHVRLAGLFASWLKNDWNFEIMAPPQLSLVCFRLNPGNMSEEQLSGLNQQLLDRINESGEIFLTHTRLKDSFCIRMAIGSRTTEERHVTKAWEIIQKASESLLKE